MVGECKELGGCVIFELVAFFGFLVKAVYPSARGFINQWGGGFNTFVL